MERQFIYEMRKPRWFSAVTLFFVFGALVLLGMVYFYQYASAKYRELKESDLEAYERWSNGEYPFFGGYVQEFKKMADENARQEKKFYYLAVAGTVGAVIVFLGSFYPLIRYAWVRKFGMKYSATVEQDTKLNGAATFHYHGVEFPVSLRTYIHGKDTVVFAARRKSPSSAVRQVGTTIEISKLGKYIVVCD